MAPFNYKLYRKLAKGFNRKTKSCPRIMIPRVHKALQHAYRDRRQRRRLLRSEWIATINASTNEHNIKYSQFISGLTNSNLKLDRKILAQIALTEPFTFKAIIDEIKIQGELIDFLINMKGKIEEIQSKTKVSMLEAYAKNLLIDGPVKEVQKQLIDAPYPFYIGKREPVQSKILEAIKKQKEIDSYYKEQQQQNKN